MGKPYDLYLRFLVTKGLHDTKEINEALEGLALPKVSDDEIDRQYHIVFDHIPKPVQKQIETQSHEGDFRRWMKMLEVDELWSFEKRYKRSEDQWLKLVYDIHSDPKLRLTLGAILMKGVKPSDVMQMVNLKYACMLREPHIEVYQKFFWNIQRMTRADWKRYLSHVDNYEKMILFTCLSEDVEAVKVALDLPSTSHVSEMLQYMMANAYAKAKHYLRSSSPATNGEARKWVDTTLKLVDKYQKHRTGDIDDFGKSLQMEFDYVASEFMTPDDQMKSEMEAERKKLEEASEAVKDV